MNLPIALQLFTVRDRIENDVEGTLRKIKNLGYDGIEVCNGSYGMDPLEFKALCDNIGLEIISAHVGAGSIINETEETLDLYKKLGVSYIAIPALWGDYAYGESQHDEMMRKLNIISGTFKENGIQVLFHNHMWEFKKDGENYILDNILSTFGNDNLLPEIDVCWATVGHGNASDYMKKYDSRCPVVHLKDFYCKGDHEFSKNNYREPAEFALRPVGYGRVDMIEVLDTAEAIGAKWLIVEQDTPAFGLSDIECAALSINWIKTVCK